MRGRVTQKVTSETSAATSIQKIIRAIPIGSDDGNRRTGPPKRKGCGPKKALLSRIFITPASAARLGAFRLKY